MSPLARFVHALPKVELHVHLEGSIQPDLALELAARRGVRLPGAETGADGLRAAYRFPSFRAFIELYLALSRCLQRAEDFALATSELARSLAASNVRHAEVTFTPMTHAARGVSDDEMIEGLVLGRARARAEHGVGIRFVLDVVRTLPDQAAPTLAFALALRRRDPEAALALGLAGPERDEPVADAIVDAFDRARAEGLRSLPHAGEGAGARNVWEAVRRLHADRIGHGVRCLEDPALVDHLREHRIALEVCPSSNVALGVVADLAHHPLPELLARGLAVSLATDDPPLFATDLVREHVRCAEAFGWDCATLRRLAAEGVAHSFLPDDEKAALEAEQARVPEDPLTEQ